MRERALHIGMHSEVFLICAYRLWMVKCGLVFMKLEYVNHSVHLEEKKVVNIEPNLTRARASSLENRQPVDPGNPRTSNRLIPRHAPMPSENGPLPFNPIFTKNPAQPTRSSAEAAILTQAPSLKNLPLIDPRNPQTSNRLIPPQYHHPTAPYSSTPSSRKKSAQPAGPPP